MRSSLEKYNYNDKYNKLQSQQLQFLIYLQKLELKSQQIQLTNTRNTNAKSDLILDLDDIYVLYSFNNF